MGTLTRATIGFLFFITLVVEYNANVLDQAFGSGTSEGIKEKAKNYDPLDQAFGSGTSEDIKEKIEDIEDIEEKGKSLKDQWNKGMDDLKTISDTDLEEMAKQTWTNVKNLGSDPTRVGHLLDME